MMGYTDNDGGRAAAGFKGSTGDCVVRAVAIASGLPYREVYDTLSAGMSTQRSTKRTKAKPSARNGVSVRRKWFKDYMAALGFRWVPTMQIGSGCKVHLIASELPPGRLVVMVSNHFTTMIDGIIHDTFDPRREMHCSEPIREPMPEGYWSHDGKTMHHIERRCVYGYYIKEG